MPSTSASPEPRREQDHEKEPLSLRRPVASTVSASQIVGAALVLAGMTGMVTLALWALSRPTGPEPPGRGTGGGTYAVDGAGDQPVYRG